ncbi:MAG: cell division protein FtsL [Pseudomonadales bacterium]
MVSYGVQAEQIKLLLVYLMVVVLVVASALGVIYSSFKSRQLFSYLQQQNRETRQLEEEWGRLLLEQSTWASHARIERLAKSKLNMVVPDPAAIIVVKQ